MGNNTIDSKLDETVKQSLDSYEANYDSGDWSRMERMLDAAPKSISKPGSYNVALVIGASVLVIGALIYKAVSSSKDSTPVTTEEIITPEAKPETIAKPVPAPKPAVVASPSVQPTVKETAVVKAPVIVPETKTAPAIKTTVPAITEKTTKDKKQIKEADTSTKHQKVSVMGNEPIFGDMIDSSKGIIRETKEKESTKKAAKATGTSGIGFSGLLNLNADSIKKQKELMKKDSIPK